MNRFFSWILHLPPDGSRRILLLRLMPGGAFLRSAGAAELSAANTL